jgi:hypothetical protein
MEEQAKPEAKWEEESKMLKQSHVSRVEQRCWGTIGASRIGTMLFQHHRYVAILLCFCFVADFLFLLKVHWWQRVWFLVLYVVCNCLVFFFLMAFGCFYFILFSVGFCCWGFVQSWFFHGSDQQNMIDWLQVMLCTTYWCFWKRVVVWDDEGGCW